MTTESNEKARLHRCPRCGDDVLVARQDCTDRLADHAFAPGYVCDGSGRSIPPAEEAR